MKQIQKSAFTLIELLVVITIIGILSTIGIATFGNMRESAQMANPGTISAQIGKELKLQAAIAGVSPLGIWNFDNNLGDSSGQGHSMVISSGNVTFNESSNSLFGTHYVSIENGLIWNTLDAVNMFPDGFSLSYITKVPDFYGGAISLWANPARYFTVGLTQESFISSELGLSLNEKPVSNQEWHHVLVSYKDGIAKVWIDGKLLAEETDLLGTTNQIYDIRISTTGGGYDQIYIDNLEFYPIAIKPNSF